MLINRCAFIDARGSPLNGGERLESGGQGRVTALSRHGLLRGITVLHLQPRIEFPRHRADGCPIIWVCSPVLLAMKLKEFPKERHEPLIQTSPLDRIAHEAAPHDVVESQSATAKYLGHFVIFCPEALTAFTVVTRETTTSPCVLLVSPPAPLLAIYVRAALTKITGTTAAHTPSSTGMLIQKFDDGLLPKIDLEALYPDLNLALREPLFDLYPAQLGDNVRRRPLVDQKWRLGSR